MKKFKIQVNNRGNMTLPTQARKILGNELIGEIVDEGILLRPAFTVPIELYTNARIAEFDQEEEELGKVLESKKL